VSDIATRVIQRWSDTTISTHYDGCWEWHPHCAVAILADEIERLRAEFSAVLGDAIAKDAEVERLRAALRLAGFFPWWSETAELAAERAEVERLRAAGDALAEVADEWPELVEAWREARRER
jgi:hypothetical protein